MKITIGLSLSLSGRYLPIGRQIEAALRLLVAQANGQGGISIGSTQAELALDCIDDQSNASRCADIYHSLIAERRADLLLGPYSSGLASVAAPVAEGARHLFVNHGGSADTLYERGYKMIVGVACPASNYLTDFVRLLATLKFWRKRVALVAPTTPFARAVVGGFEAAVGRRSARRRGVRIRVRWRGRFGPETPAALFPALRRNRVNVVTSVGSYDHDLSVMRAVIGDSRLNIPVLACVAAGVSRFHSDLGDNAEGIVGPSLWETDLDLVPDLGPAPADFARSMRSDAGISEVDYPAAQAYAGAMLAMAAVGNAQSLEPDKLRAAFSHLHTTTLFGPFAIDPATGRQIAHTPLLVQWHRGRKVVIEPEPELDAGSLELPSGWRIIAAGIELLKLNRPAEHDDNEDEIAEVGNPTTVGDSKDECEPRD